MNVAGAKEGEEVGSVGFMRGVGGTVGVMRGVGGLLGC